MEIAHNPDGSLNPSLIRVAPGVAGLTDGQIGLYFGHELVHVQDLLVSPFLPGTAAGYRSEVRAYQWQLDNLNSFNVGGLEQTINIQKQLQNYLQESKADLMRTQLGY